MQTASLMRTSGLVSTSQHSIHRTPVQKILAPTAVTLRQRGFRTIRAEADKPGDSITNSGKTDRPDSYEVQWRP